MLSKQIFWKGCVENCLEIIKNDKFGNIGIFRDEIKGTLFPYLCIIAIYIIWLLILMISNTFLLWYICCNHGNLFVYNK